MFELMDNHNEEAVIKVIGVGGGGGNAIEHMVKHSIEGVEFIAINTDAQVLRSSSANITLQ
ncbi:MAG: cell division protein FtsZ, partial [Paraglaciecola sp.]